MQGIGNPNHQVSRALEGQWHKLLLILMRKLNLKEVVITPKDIELLGGAAGAVVAHDKADGLHLYYVSATEAERLARLEGGLPN